MMQDTTNHRSKKVAPILCAVVIIALLAIYFAIVFFPLLGLSLGTGMAWGILILYAIIIFAVIAGILIALFQRLREIEGGEEDDAKQY